MTSSTTTDDDGTAPAPAAIAELQSVIDLKRARYHQLRNELDALGPELRRYESALRLLTVRSAKPGGGRESGPLASPGPGEGRRRTQNRAPIERSRGRIASRLSTGNPAGPRC